METRDHQEGPGRPQVVPHGHTPAPETIQSPCKRLEAADIPVAACQIPDRAPIWALFILALLEDRHEIAFSSIHRLRGHARSIAVGGPSLGPDGLCGRGDAAR